MNSSESVYEHSPDETEAPVKAEFLSRVIARTIDFIIVAALVEIIPVIGYFAGLAYLLLADGMFRGRSVGKRLIGLKVVVRNNDGTESVCGYKESIFRNFPFAAGYILCGILAVIPLIGWLFSFVIIAVVVIFESIVLIGSDNNSRLGDEMAKTQVVEDKQGGFNVS